MCVCCVCVCVCVLTDHTASCVSRWGWRAEPVLCLNGITADARVRELKCCHTLLPHCSLLAAHYIFILTYHKKNRDVWLFVQERVLGLPSKARVKHLLITCSTWHTIRRVEMFGCSCRRECWVCHRKLGWNIWGNPWVNNPCRYNETFVVLSKLMFAELMFAEQQLSCTINIPHVQQCIYCICHISVFHMCIPRICIVSVHISVLYLLFFISVIGSNCPGMSGTVPDF